MAYPKGALAQMRHFINILIVWRLYELLSDEGGPFDVLEHAREYLLSLESSWADELREGMDCVYCSTIWYGAIVARLRGEKHWWLIGLAYSAGAVMLSLIVGILRNSVSAGLHQNLQKVAQEVFPDGTK